MFNKKFQFAAEGDTLTQLKGKFRPLERLPVPSGWHAEVMWRATAAKAKLQRVKEAVDDTLLFLKLYPNHAYAEEAKKLLEEAKEFEKEKAANKISNIEKPTEQHLFSLLRYE